MKNIHTYIITLLLLIHSSMGNCASSCPKIDDEQHLTLNGYGRSSYRLNSLLLIEAIDNTFKINKNLPALDVGSGFGEFVYNILPTGIKKIYINDLDKKNLFCIRRNLREKYPEQIDNIEFIAGNFIKNNVESKIPDNSIGFINAKNVIHFFKFDELFKFAIISNKKLVKNGYLFLVFENKYLNEQKQLIEHIDSQAKTVGVKTIEGYNNVIKKEYHEHNFGGLDLNCSFETFEKTNNNIKMPGFPCQLNEAEQHHISPSPIKTYQLIIPEYLASILEKSGFKNIRLATMEKNPGVYLVLAQKK